MTRQLDLTVQGVVGTNPVLSRVGEAARPYCRFRVAVTPSFRTDQGWNDGDTVWFTAKAWGSLAANISHSIRKGDAVLLAGRFSQESWEADGVTHQTNVITLHSAGHDLTRGESRFARVRQAETLEAPEPAESAPSPSAAGDTDAPAAHAAGGAGIMGDVAGNGTQNEVVADPSEHTQYATRTENEGLAADYWNTAEPVAEPASYLQADDVTDDIAVPAS